MSQPLIMSFRPDAAQMCIDGRKRQTRRVALDGTMIQERTQVDISANIHGAIGAQPLLGMGPIAAILSEKRRTLWRVGETIAIKPGRTAKALGRVMCTGLRVEHVHEITEEDARAEGMEYREWENPNWVSRFSPTTGWSSRWHELGTLSQYASGGDRKNPAPLIERDLCLGSARHAFANCWSCLYPRGPKSWEANPLVVVIEFEPHASGGR